MVLITFLFSCYASPCSVLPYILFQFLAHSLHTDFCSDYHALRFDTDKRFRLVEFRADVVVGKNLDLQFELREGELETHFFPRILEIRSYTLKI